MPQWNRRRLLPSRPVQALRRFRPARHPAHELPTGPTVIPRAARRRKPPLPAPLSMRRGGATPRRVHHLTTPTVVAVPPGRRGMVIPQRLPTRALPPQHPRRRRTPTTGANAGPVPRRRPDVRLPVVARAFAGRARRRRVPGTGANAGPVPHAPRRTVAARLMMRGHRHAMAPRRASLQRRRVPDLGLANGVFWKRDRRPAQVPPAARGKSRRVRVVKPANWPLISVRKTARRVWPKSLRWRCVKRKLGALHTGLNANPVLHGRHSKRPQVCPTLRAGRKRRGRPMLSVQGQIVSGPGYAVEGDLYVSGAVAGQITEV
jgi:hypothetical protein